MSDFQAGYYALWVIDDDEKHVLTVTSRDWQDNDMMPYEHVLQCWFDKERRYWKSSMGDGSKVVMHVFQGSNDPAEAGKARSYTVQRFLEAARDHLNAALEAVRDTEGWP